MRRERLRSVLGDRPRRPEDQGGDGGQHARRHEGEFREPLHDRTSSKCTSGWAGQRDPRADCARTGGTAPAMSWLLAGACRVALAVTSLSRIGLLAAASPLMRWPHYRRPSTATAPP